MNTRKASIIVSITFVLVGILGFIPNPIVGMHDSIFHADTVHNMVHIISGTLFLLVAFAAPVKSAAFMKLFGVIYFLIGMVGLLCLKQKSRLKINLLF